MATKVSIIGAGDLGELSATLTRRFTSKDFRSFLLIAANEVEYLVLFSFERGILDRKSFENFIAEAGKTKTNANRSDQKSQRFKNLELNLKIKTQ